ncbi:GNAT family N-acetyltransferase [Streptomyces sp. NPDC047028]|uniref:GNAT family N-acetyltransferase n=1 Tax=Streptomyces sp. NPDC047028 TaxID=3155793 RepID=UPI0033DCE69C
MSLVRRALPEDAVEVLRLRQIMIDSVFEGGEGGATDWQTASLPTLLGRLAESDGAGAGGVGAFVAYVIDHPERPGALGALAAGSLEYRIGRAGNPHGRVGHVFSVATDPDVRRRGYARACMEELLAWFRQQGAAQVDLNASAAAEPLYASLGFVRKPDPSMRLDL